MTDTISAEQTVSTLIDNAKVVEQQGNYAAAEELFKAAKTLTKKLLGVKHVLYIDCLYHLAVCNQKQNRSAIARDLVIHSLESINDIVTDIHSDMRWQAAFHLLAELSC
jgi:hypothetical protein